MSKGRGKKLGLKFTHNLIGDNLNNESAFTVKGKEYQYVNDPDKNGPIVDVMYDVESVENYPTPVIWETDGHLLINSSEYTGNVVPVMTSNTSSDGILTFSIENNNISNRAFRAFDNDESTRWTTGGANNVSSAWIAYEFTSGKVISKYRIMSSGVSAPRDWVFEGYDGDKFVELDHVYEETYEPKQFKDFEVANPDKFEKYRLNMLSNNGSTFFMIHELQLLESINYDPSFIYESEAIESTGPTKVNWDSYMPENTNIKIEYTTGVEQGEWTEVNHADIVDSDTNIWLRATLTTDDDTVTPILRKLWLEVPGPEDTLLLTVNDSNRFNNVIGDITVMYDESIGNLVGRGGPVASFEHSFTPEDIEPLPNPGHSERVGAKVGQADIELKEIQYLDIVSESHVVGASVGETTISLKDVNVINP